LERNRWSPFFPALATVPSVQAALHKKFGERAPEILNNLKAGLAIPDAAHNIISDLVHNESTSAAAIDGLNDYGEFYIHIMRFGQFIGSKQLSSTILGILEHRRVPDVARN
jgi:hypothetical protein